MMNDDDLLFTDEDNEAEIKDSLGRHSWKILIVDDEKSIHDVSRLALQ